jgi:hypothetical protein
MVKEKIQDMMFTTSPPAELELTVKRTFLMSGRPVCMSKETIILYIWWVKN